MNTCCKRSAHEIRRRGKSGQMQQDDIGHFSRPRPSGEHPQERHEASAPTVASSAHYGKHQRSAYGASPRQTPAVRLTGVASARALQELLCNRSTVDNKLGTSAFAVQLQRPSRHWQASPTADSQIGLPIDRLRPLQQRFPHRPRNRHWPTFTARAPSFNPHEVRRLPRSNCRIPSSLQCSQ